MDFDKKWIIKIGDKEHTIEADYGAHVVDPENQGDLLFNREGTLVVDGKSVRTWNGSELPKEISVEIESKPVILRKAGIFVKGLELSFEGRKINPIEM